MNMRLKLICCDVLFRMACRAAAVSRNIIDMEFTKLQSHNEPDILRGIIQDLIDKADAEGVYDAILLGYGLCGNSVAGLTARAQRLVIPRAHDCCTLFLGSRGKFSEHFGERLSAQWSSHGYLERSNTYKGGTDLNKNLGLDRDYAELVEQYGEENAEYLWETLHPAHNVGKDERIYIDVSPFDGKDGGDFHYKRFEGAVNAEAGAAADVRITRLKGSTRLIDMLLDGEWGADFLIVPPGKSIMAIYDMERVMKST
jgi:hypothetical protein